MNLLQQYIDDKSQYYIYGTTGLGMYCYDTITKNYGEDRILGFVETEPTHIVVRDKKVYRADDLRDNLLDYKVIIASLTYGDAMVKKLLEVGVDEERIIILEKLRPYFRTLRENKNRIKKICFWPFMEGYNELLEKKITWFIPANVEVTIWGNSNLRKYFKNNVRVETQDVNEWLDEADKIYVWKVDDTINQLHKYEDKIHVVDLEFYYKVETLNWGRVYYDSLSDETKKEFYEESCKIFDGMINTYKTVKSANVFCSGPSIGEFQTDFYSNDFNVICNSMVKDEKLMELLKPNLLCFGDLNYFLSPTSYCKKFLEDVRKMQERYGFYIVVFEYQVPLLLYHYPEFKGKVIGVSDTAKEYIFPSKDNLQVKSVASILTIMMLPMASAVADKVGVFGATGRVEGETFFWQHNHNTQYHDLMPSVFEAYPSFFRDQDYGGFYEEYCKAMEDIISYGESIGKEYVNHTTSFIPALKKRSQIL